jgi:DNA-directed RNA polymerase I, II, and III subunit RPABC1
MLRRRGYVTSTDITDEQFRERFCLYDNTTSSWLVDREKLSISVIHRDRSRNMRVFFIGTDVFGKKQLQDVCNKLGEDNMRVIIVLHDITRVSPTVKTMIDEMNRNNKKMSVQIFTEEELVVDFAARTTTFYEHDLMTDEEKQHVLDRIKATKTLFLPRIATNDPLARYFGLKAGDMLGVVMASPAAGKYSGYKICVNLEDAPKATKRMKKN